jgi:enoyl-CoA hydratase/carnithine racemase
MEIRHETAGCPVSALAGYQGKYPNLAFERRDGVLQITLHQDGGEFVVSETALRDLGKAFVDVAEDSANRVVILTGTGDRFATQFDYASFIETMKPDIYDYWVRIRTDGVRLLRAFLDIEVPVISAINGPVVTHSETPLLADVVLASEDTVFQDATHFVKGLPPGDGMHVVWTSLLGLNRGRHFLLTGRVLSAQEALELGVVGEVLPRAELLPRAWELATRWASYSSATLRGTRAVLTSEWRRLINEQLHTGLTHEAFAGTCSGVLPAPETPVRDLDPR